MEYIHHGSLSQRGGSSITAVQSTMAQPGSLADQHLCFVLAYDDADPAGPADKQPHGPSLAFGTGQVGPGCHPPSPLAGPLPATITPRPRYLVPVQIPPPSDNSSLSCEKPQSLLLLVGWARPDQANSSTDGGAVAGAGLDAILADRRISWLTINRPTHFFG